MNAAITREREGADRAEVRRYTVRRWSAFEWTDEEPPEDMGRLEARRLREGKRKEREDHLTRAAAMIQAKLVEKRADWNPTVRLVSVEKQPQLLFELTVPGVGEDDARKRAMYAIMRGLSVGVPTGRVKSNRRPERISLAPPWGKLEIEVVRG